MSGELHEIECEVMVNYRSMKDYRELGEPDLEQMYEYRMNDALLRLSDLHKYLGTQPLIHADEH